MLQTAKLMDWDYNDVKALPLPEGKGLPDVIWYAGKAYGYYAHTVQVGADGQAPFEAEPPYREIPHVRTLEALRGQTVYVAPFFEGLRSGDGVLLQPEVRQMTIDPWKETCDACGARFENIGHPLKPGVVMMRSCKCEFVMQQGSDGVNVTIRQTPSRVVLAKE